MIELLASLAARMRAIASGDDSSCVGKTPIVPIHKETLADICHHLDTALGIGVAPQSIPMILTCPACGERHFDEGEFATKVHHTHACQHCGMVWRPALVPTVGVQFLPGFKNAGLPQSNTLGDAP